VRFSSSAPALAHCPAVEDGDDSAALNTCKLKLLGVTLCLHRVLRPVRGNSFCCHKFYSLTGPIHYAV
jgi:hypothetical protein